MSRQIVLHRPSPSLDRLEPLLAAGNNSSFSSATTRRSVSFGEVAGGTTAECAAVFCCCPCSLVNLMYLTIYKLPKGLCRKVLVHHRRKRLTRKGMLPQRNCRCSCGCDDTEVHIHSISLHTTPASDRYIKSLGSDEEVMQLEKEMWGKFHGSGFGRSASQRSDVV
ncbi:hypothetical protein NMG60_11008644 [Bertholletia excelsa]